MHIPIATLERMALAATAPDGEQPEELLLEGPSTADFEFLETLAAAPACSEPRKLQFSILFLLLILIVSSLPLAVWNLHLHFREVGGDPPHSAWHPWKFIEHDPCPGCGMG